MEKKSFVTTDVVRVCNGSDVKMEWDQNNGTKNDTKNNRWNEQKQWHEVNNGKNKYLKANAQTVFLLRACTKKFVF